MPTRARPAAVPTRRCSLPSRTRGSRPPVLARVTRTRLRFLERLYGGLGVDLDSAHRYARPAYAVYLGTADLRRAEQDEEVEDEEIERRAQLYVAAVVPPAEGAPAC